MKVYIICCVLAQILYLKKNQDLEIWAKILLANQIAAFLNQLYLQNKTMKKPIFLHVDTN